MLFGRFHNAKAGPRQQRLWLVRHPLTVLETAGGVVGDRKTRWLTGWTVAEARQEFGDVDGQAGDGFGAGAPLFRLSPEHETVVLHRSPTAGRVDDDRVEV